MYKHLIELFKNKPLPYETADTAFWDDEHISQSMLSAHLASQIDGATRRHAYIKQSVDWIAGF